MASKNQRNAKRIAKIESMFGGAELETVCTRIQKTLAVDNRQRKPETAHVKSNVATLKTARATKHGARKPFVISKT